MILVDTSVWIDFFSVKQTEQSLKLEKILYAGRACTGDLVLVELLQGLRSDREFEWTRSYMLAIPVVEICDTATSIAAARNYRLLRGHGFTIRSTIDTLIATRCLQDDLPLLTSDRDFAPFVKHLGLRNAMAEG